MRWKSSASRTRKLGVKIVGTTKQVKDECKVQKIGRCGSQDTSL